MAGATEAVIQVAVIQVAAATVVSSTTTKITMHCTHACPNGYISIKVHSAS